MKKVLIIATALLVMGTNVFCSLGGTIAEPEATEAAENSTATFTPEPTELPVEEDIETLTTPTPTVTPTPKPEPTATPTEIPVNIALTAQEAYEQALAEAEAWQPDVVLNELATTLLGPLDAEGKSEAWAVKFWSSSEQATNSMLFNNGTLHASPVAMPNEQRVINMDTVILDTKNIYDTAFAAGGGEYIDQGYTASTALTPYPLDITRPMWYVNYQHPEEYTVIFSVIIDARTGEVVQAISLE